MKKRWMSLLLVLCLLFNCVVTVSAVEPEEIEEDETAVEVVQEFEIKEEVEEEPVSEPEEVEDVTDEPGEEEELPELEEEEPFEEEIEDEEEDALAEWEAQLGDFTMTPANAYTPTEAENLLAAEEREHAYTPDATEEEEESVSAEYVEGEVLYARSGSVSLFGMDDVDAELAALGIVSSEEVYTSGGEVSLFGMSDEAAWYRAEIEGDVLETVEALKDIRGIETAEPNYIYSADSIGEPEEAEKQNSWFLNSDADKKGLSASSGWKQAISMSGKAPGTGAVVAVIDTGVDYTHEDLAASMWVNTAELDGTAGVDDDGNGYIDDIYGIDATGNIRKATDPMDDNGHGTHVAGIIAMSNNKTGGVGIAYGAKIMAIKAGQSTGTFSAADIAEAIQYAKSMGADVINMSFGGTGKSNLIETALEDAFSTCVLVASAGNDGLPTTDAPEAFLQKEDIYPAAYRYVLGVMASDENGGLAGFSNWDYIANANAEYELAAPGTNIFSTLPGNRYANWNGTSMAAPCVSAAAAVLRGCYMDKDEYNSRFIMGQLASATETSVTYVDEIGEVHVYPKLDLYQSLVCLPEPNLSVSQVFALDNEAVAEKNDGDRILDAGETVELGIAIRNQWGKTGTVTVKADAVSDAGVANKRVTFINDTITLEPIGAYSETDNGYVWEDSYLAAVENPIRFVLDPETPNDAQIRIKLTVTTSNGWDESDSTVYEAESEFVFRVQNGRGIRGHISEDTTLTADTYWIIENALVIDEGATLTVEPGTQIQVWSSDYEDAYGGKTMAYINNNGTLNMIGTEQKPIEVFPGAEFEKYVVEIAGAGVETLEYCKIVNAKLGYIGWNSNLISAKVSSCDHCEFWQTDERIYTRCLETNTGNVTESSSWMDKEAFWVGVLKNSIAHNFTGCSGSSHQSLRQIRVAQAENNLFDNCAIKNYTGSLHERDVFLRNWPWENRSSVSSSRFEATKKIPMEEPVFTTPFTYDGAASKYVIAEPYAFESERDLMEDLAAELDGSLLILNDADEENAIAQKLREIAESKRLDGNTANIEMRIYMDYIYDADLDDWIWGDGNSYVPAASKSFSPPLTTYCYGTYEIYSYPTYVNAYLENISGTYNSNYSYVLEFPADCTDEEIEELLSDFDYAEWKTHNITPDVTNSAILNPVLDANSDRWMQFTAPQYDPDHYYALHGNYWGTENKTLINKMIQDDDDFAGVRADIREDPILTLDDDLSDIYPFVTAIWLTEHDSDIVVEDAAPGITYDVHVTYNRDMEPTVQPAITYGGEAPFTDYKVYGDWVSDREWVGTTKISNVATGGNQIFRAKGGCAEDDNWLVCGTDELRFQFHIDSASAQSIVLNAAGGVDQVNLAWAQNDYDVLGGYNLYRGASATGSFTKLNDTILTGTTYTDTAVEAGKTYYYYFTVVDTDGNEIPESKSNVANATPMDNITPTITHTPVTSAKAGSAVTVSAVVKDNIAVSKVILWYRTKGADLFSTVDMTYVSATDKYTGTIPKSAVTAAGVEYYIEAMDNNGNRQTSGSKGTPYTISTDATPTLLTAFPSTIDTGSQPDITVYGTHFAENMTVKLGTVSITEFTVSEDGTSVTFTAPNLPIGTYSVVVTVDGKSVSLTNAVTYREVGSYVQINDGTVLSGETLRLPVYVGVSGELTAFYAEVMVPTTSFSNAKAELAEGINGSLVSNYSGGKLSFSMASGTDFNPGSQKPLAYLVLTPKAVQTETAVHLTLTSGRLNGAETVTSEMKPAVTIYPNFTVNVMVKYFQDQTAVSGVTVRAAGASGTTGADGKLALTGINRADVTIVATKDGYTESDVEAFDAVLALRNSVGLETLNEYQLIAGDVNLDGRVDEVDASLILKKSVFLIDSFPAGSWAFVPASKSVTLTSTATTVNFTAILIGDINGSWQESAE